MKRVFSIPRIAILTFLLAAGLGRWLPDAPAPAAPAPPGKTLAERQYNQFCVRCHGKDFTGGPMRELGRRIPDFTSARWQDDRSDDELHVSILDGKGAQMPAFAGKLREDEVRELVHLLRRANPKRPRTVEARPSDFQKRYDDLRKKLEELRKEYRELTDAEEEKVRRP
jgi:mono/diheme cytochrome c family protein